MEVFATEAAGEQYAALRKAVDEAGVPWVSAGGDAIAALSGAVTPQGIVAVCRFLDAPLDDVLSREASSRDPSRNHHPRSSSAPTSATRATRAP